MDHEPTWLTLEEAATVLKVGVPTIQSLINRDLLALDSAQDPPRIAYQAVLDFLRRDQRTLSEQGHQPPDLGMIPD
ncbi:MAG TPA: helix-turn-helix domain-containing protein [Herpetosiphonaceae bacterium]|nr:helix-turn-helix domain-containing protein [Herpetosiphonaceae bacterium]